MSKNDLGNEVIYDKIWSKIGAFKETSPGSRWSKWLLTDIVRDIPRSDVRSIADIGCGEGTATATLAGLFPDAQALGLDFAEGAIQSASQRFAAIPNLRFVRADATEQDQQGQRYDMVCAFELLEHVEDWQSLLGQIIDSANRYVVLSFPTGRMRKYETQIGHFRNFKKNEVENFILQTYKNIKPIKVYYAGFPFYSPIGRDIMNHFFKFYDEKVLTDKRGPIKKVYEAVMYFLFRYMSTKKRFGEQFFALFEKQQA